MTKQVTCTEGFCLFRFHLTYLCAPQGLPQMHGESHLSLVPCYSVPSVGFLLVCPPLAFI